MASSARPKLSIPAVPAVSVLGAGCPAGDDGETSNETGAATSSSMGTTEAAATGMPATSGAVPACADLDEMMCNAETGCFWEGVDVGCLVDCSAIGDQATCESVGYCEWFEGACYTTI